MTDSEIITAVIAGETVHFRELVKRYEPRIAAIVLNMLGNIPEAEDVGQETFIRFYKNIKSFKGDSGVGTYLTRIAINLSLNEIKRQKRRNMMFNSTDTESLSIPGQSQNLELKEEKDIILNAIQKLKPKLRSVIVLRLIEEYSTAETAKILKIPMGTVLSRLARAQNKLKEILSPELEVNYG